MGECTRSREYVASGHDGHDMYLINSEGGQIMGTVIVEYLFSESMVDLPPSSGITETGHFEWSGRRWPQRAQNLKLDM